MQIHLRKYFFLLILSFSLLVSACKSQQASFPASSAATSANPPASTAKKPAPEATKTVPNPAPKLVYDSTKVSFKIKQKTEVKTYKNDDDDGEVTIRKTETVQKYRKKKLIDEQWFSGGFLAAGLILLATSLVLVIIGTGSAGLIAIIGGGLFLVGFILTMV